MKFSQNDADEDEGTGEQDRFLKSGFKDRLKDLVKPKLDKSQDPKPAYSGFARRAEYMNRRLHTKYGNNNRAHWNIVDELVKGTTKRSGIVQSRYELNFVEVGEDMFGEMLSFEQSFDLLVQLVEYYKFHIEIPRLFLFDVYSLIHRYHNSKRHIYYNTICKRLQNESSK